MCGSDPLCGKHPKGKGRALPAARLEPSHHGRYWIDRAPLGRLAGSAERKKPSDSGRSARTCDGR
jgi:hypothetical protein